MPLVIPKSGAVQYIPSQELLAEILGHSNFDCEDWAIGDRIIFEDGTQSLIKQEPGEQFFIWDQSLPANLEEVKQAVGLTEARTWKELFASFELQSRIQVVRTSAVGRAFAFGCLCALILAAVAFVAFVVWL